MYGPAMVTHAGLNIPIASQSTKTSIVMRPMFYLSVTSLLFLLGNAIARPMPVPPPLGSIVYVAPAHTAGGVQVGQGAHVPHPHIVVGHGPHGSHEVHVAPVSHTPIAAFQPHMSSAGMHHALTGNIHLGHVTAHENSLHPALGPLQGVNVGPHHVGAINQGKADVSANRHAHVAHLHAANAHIAAQHAHLTAANAHTTHATGNPNTAQLHNNAAQQHTALAAQHGTQVGIHNVAAANHLAEARTHTVHGSAAQAQQSLLSAQHSTNNANGSAHIALASSAHLAAAGAHAGASAAHEAAAYAHQTIPHIHPNSPFGAQQRQIVYGHQATAAGHAQDSRDHATHSLTPIPAHLVLAATQHAQVSQQGAQQSHASATAARHAALQLGGHAW
ncbi:hypothetical protein B0H34DRAFT_821367 [Crassisporium funariophilum]|nr:hypothetical protein B0H34DRAFT_821367 [Crassisporium funariophilum]